VLLIVAGGWLLHQAYASGPAAVVVAATTLIDPLSAVAVGIGFYGEAARTGFGQAAMQVGFALLAGAGVIILARSVPDPAPSMRSMTCPTLVHRTAGDCGSWSARTPSRRTSTGRRTSPTASLEGLPAAGTTCT
jgi:hypothetical protein